MSEYISFKLRFNQKLFSLFIVMFLAQPSFAAHGQTYKCREMNFVVNNNHSFTRQNTETFSLTRNHSTIAIKGGFLTGNEFEYHNTSPNKFFGSGMNYAFTFDNGYFQWVKVSKFINELYVITAKCN